jgi:hypothetical protein
MANQEKVSKAWAAEAANSRSLTEVLAYVRDTLRAADAKLIEPE